MVKIDKKAIAESVMREVDEWLETVGYAGVQKGVSYYYELEACVEDGISKANPIKVKEA